MVVTHSYAPYGLRNFFFAFQMPLFILCSGYCFKTDYFANRKKYITKRISRIYWPFVKYSFVFMLLHYFLCDTGVFHMNMERCIYSDMGCYDYVKMAILVAFKLVEPEHLLGGFWFVRELFLASVMYIGITMLCTRKFFLFGIVPFAILTFMLLCTFDVSFWCFSRITFFALAFYATGFLLKDAPFKKSVVLLFASFVCVFVFSCVSSYNMKTVDIYWVVPYYCVAILGFIMVISIALFICNWNCLLKKLLVYVGKNTLVVLAFHLLAMKVVTLVIILIGELGLEHLSDYPTVKSDFVIGGGWLFYATAGVAFPLLGKRLLKNFS